MGWERCEGNQWYYMVEKTSMFFVDPVNLEQVKVFVPKLPGSDKLLVQNSVIDDPTDDRLSSTDITDRSLVNKWLHHVNGYDKEVPEWGVRILNDLDVDPGERDHLLDILKQMFKYADVMRLFNNINHPKIRTLTVPRDQASVQEALEDFGVSCP